MQRYELTAGSSSKFWEAGIRGNVLTVRFGRIGTQGQSKDKTFAAPAAAQAELDRLVREKTGKGYLPADGAAASAPPRREDPPAAPVPDRAEPAAVAAPAAGEA
ncbi:WGR domain-containing protein, partial [Methylobacterium oryzihabitans]